MPLEFDADDQELALFLAETIDHLQSLDQNLVKLEVSGDDPVMLATIFRSAHTIKGGAGMIGHTRMAQLAHAAENVLDALRSHTIGVSPRLIDTLLAALDGLRVLTDEITTRVEADLDIVALAANLNACLTATDDTLVTPPVPAQVVATVGQNIVSDPGALWHHDLLPADIDPDTAFAVTVRVDPDSGLTAARIMQSMMDLGRSAHIYATRPEMAEIEINPDIAEYRALVTTDLMSSELEYTLGEGTDVISAAVRKVIYEGDPITSDQPVTMTEAWPATIRPSDIEASDLYTVHVEVDPECGLAAARSLQAIIELQRSSRVIVTVPQMEYLDSNPDSHVLRALIGTTEDAIDLRTRLTKLPDVLRAVVLPATFNADDVTKAPAVTAAIAETTAAVPPSEATKKPVAAKTPTQKTTPPAAPESSIRIAVSIVDSLMSLVSELVLSRGRLQTLCGDLGTRFPDDEGVNQLGDAVSQLDRLSGELQGTVMKARMLPVENVFNKFPRLMRDLASQKGKKVTFTMLGQETELDRSVIEQLSDPLVHLLRNAIDHGMESPAERIAAGKPEVGSIELSAAAQDNSILIRVVDNGGGIDHDRVLAKALSTGIITQEAADRMSMKEKQELIFAPGLSTAATLTDISGRGVGMDIVKSTLEKMGGHIGIDSVLGEGTTFSITLPLTLAIMQALLVEVNGGTYAVPLNTVTEILSVPEESIQTLQGTEITRIRGAVLPLIRLRDAFGVEESDSSGFVHIVGTRIAGQALGLVVDHFIGEQEIVMKPLGSHVGAPHGISGATILGDGRIGLLIDTVALKSTVPV